MTAEEYKERYKILTDNYNQSILNLEKDYVRETSIAKVGDVIKETYGKVIKVENVRIGMRFSPNHETPPPINYIGVLLTKKGEPNKRGEKYCISETQIAELNGVAINNSK